MSGLSLAVRKSVFGLDKMLPVAAILLGGGLILFAMSRVLWLSMVLMLFTGFGVMQVATASNTIIQTIVPEDKRGRAMSYYTMAFAGMTPFGSLLAGALAHAIGAPLTLVIDGICCVAGAAWFATRLKSIRAHVHPMYTDMGILPADVLKVGGEGGIRTHG